MYKNVERRDMVTKQLEIGSPDFVARTGSWSSADGSLSRINVVCKILSSGLLSYSRACWTIALRVPKPHARVPTMMSAVMRLKRAQ